MTLVALFSRIQNYFRMIIKFLINTSVLLEFSFVSSTRSNQYHETYLHPENQIFHISFEVLT